MALRLRWRLFFFSRSFWITLVILLSTTILFLFGSYQETGQNDASKFFCWHFSDFTTFLCACAVLSGLQVCYSFQIGITRYIVSTGVKRSTWIIAEFLSWLIFSFALIFLDLILSTGIAILVFGNEQSLIALFSHVVVVCLRSVPLYFGLLSLFFAIGSILQNGGITIAVNVVLSLAVYASTRVMRGGDSFVAAINPAYQLGQISEFAYTLSAQYYLSAAFSVLVGLCFMWLGIRRFSNQELL